MRFLRSAVRSYPLVVATVVVLALVAGLALSGSETPARWIGSAYALAVVLWIGVGMVRDILKGHWGLDILAVVAIVSTVVVGEYLAAVIVVLMLTGGQALEDYAASRATRELDALLRRAPQTAHRISETAGAQEIADVHVTEVQPGDRLLIRPSEVVPVDGELVSESAELDESSITGESLPVMRYAGDDVLSGALNETAAFEMVATRSSADSQYQQIVDLVREAQESKAPMVRLADRFAVPFTAVSLAIAGVAWWLSGDPVRFAEVLVLATPCPLLIAAPVAFLSGMSRAAKAGVIMKGGASLERLASARAVAFDKTGTLTNGELSLVEIRPAHGTDPDELLQLAASAEQYSTHALAASVRDMAGARGLELHPAHDAEEAATNGVSATIGGRPVVVGKPRFVASQVSGDVPRADLRAGELAAYVGIDGQYGGALVMRDTVRHNAADTITALGDLGITSTSILTGDAEGTAAHVARDLGISTVHAELLPQDKVNLVAHHDVRPVVMVGDGVNDAPVLAAADVGVAMGARGATAASESADVVVLADDISKVATAIEISQRTLRIATQAIWLGMALSLVLMVIAAFGYIPAIAGALTQEVIDVLAIGYALLALTSGRRAPVVGDRRRRSEAGEPPWRRR